jgi:hypothetical protein
VTNVFTTTNQYDCVYSMLDKPLPVVWQLYMGEPFTETNQYLCIGFGLGKGAPLPDGSGYYYGDPATYRQRWTIPTEKYYTPWLEEIGQSWDPVNQQWIINSNRQCRATAASSVNTDESAWAVAGDSGSPILMNCGKGTNEWVLMGIMASGIGLATDLKYANNAMGAGPGPFVDMEILLYVIQTGELPAESPAWKVPTPVATTAARRFPSWIPEITPFPNHGIPK